MFNYGSFKLFLLKLFLGILIVSFSLFLFVSIYTYNPNDPGMGRLIGKSEVTNFFGFWGAISSSVFTIINSCYNMFNAFKPGNFLPSNNSRRAPPPVEI